MFLHRINRKWLFVFVLIISLFSSCIKSYTPSIDRHEDLLVVDGCITDAPGPYTIKLSRSTKLEQRSQLIPYPNCQVQITDDLGNTAVLKEQKAGEYKTDPASLKGVPGRTYKLSIATPDAEYYESTPETLLKGLGIQSVYAELQHKTDAKLFYGRDGYQFYLDADDLVRTNNYLLWRLQSTYKFNADFSVLAFYDDGYMHPVFNGDSLKTCYATSDILDLLLMDTDGIQHTSIKKVPLHFEDNYTKALSIRYSLNVSQYTLTEEAYRYWDAIKKITDQGGEIYTQQPYQIKNNLKNLTHPEKPVLGYFMVAGISEKRIFVNRPPIVFRYDMCVIGDDPQSHLAEKLKKQPYIWPVFLTDRNGSIYYIDQECVDCRKKGALEKPAFWVD